MSSIVVSSITFCLIFGGALLGMLLRNVLPLCGEAVHMTSDIIRKLATELKSGIRSERQVVYLLAGVRKIIERDGIRDKYWTLNFHCDWALHSEMDRAAAQRVLRLFDEAHALLRTNVEVDDLPGPLRTETDQISKMRVFRRELFQFLAAYDLPQLGEDSPFGWTRFSTAMPE